jgi:hypothetical protein
VALKSQQLSLGDSIIGTNRAECTDRMLVYNEYHLRHALTEYAEPYNTARPHRARTFAHQPTTRTSPPSPQRIQRHDVLGGLIHEYRNAS